MTEALAEKKCVRRLTASPLSRSISDVVLAENPSCPYRKLIRTN